MKTKLLLHVSSRMCLEKVLMRKYQKVTNINQVEKQTTPRSHSRTMELICKTGSVFCRWVRFFNVHQRPPFFGWINNRRSTHISPMDPPVILRLLRSTNCREIIILSVLFGLVQLYFLFSYSKICIECCRFSFTWILCFVGRSPQT